MLKVDSGYNISLTRGDTGVFTIELVDDEGEPYTPKSGDTLRFAMAKKYGVDDPLIRKDIPTDTLILQIDPEDTKDLEFDTYYYDLELTDGFGHVSTILIAKFKVTKEVY